MILDKDNVRRIKRDKILRRIRVDLKNKHTAFISGAEILAKISQDVKEPIEMVILDGEPLNMQEMNELQVERSLRLKYLDISGIPQMMILHPIILIRSGNHPGDWPEGKEIDIKPATELLEN
jgi:predicted rRNA methylase YqxC with S4 and FtsJ domains